MRSLLRIFDSKPTQPSLLILGHPRGMTSRTWEICTRATKLKAPKQTSSGELLNHLRNPKIAKHKFYSQTDLPAGEYHQQLSLHRWGYCIKDVIQPYVCLDYVKKNPDHYRVLYIHRDPAIVHWRQQVKGWKMPHPAQFVEHFQAAADEVLTFEQVTQEPDQVFAALERLGYRVKQFNYRGNEFREILAYQTKAWQEYTAQRAA